MHVFKASRRDKEDENYTRQGISYTLLKLLKEFPEIRNEQVGQNLTLHSFRRSRAIHLYMAGMNFLYISHFLGHKNISTTELYIRHKPTNTVEILKIPYTDGLFQDKDLKSQEDKVDKFLNS